jgi:hypothetical protein
MATDVPLRCRCGKLTGTALEVAPASGTRIVCYCHDCQAFAHFLGRDDLTDAWGGTDIFQMAPARVRLDHDDDALRSVRLSAKGLYRWYCGHCKTPVANTVGARVPFVGLITSFVDLERAGTTLDALFGDPIGHVHTGAATRGGPPHARQKSMVPVITRSVRKVLGSWLNGTASPSPFFDPERKTPRIEPRVLSPEERAAL